MYLRFVVTLIDDSSHQPQGLFITAHDLINSGNLSQDERLRLQEIMIWFNKHLPSPHVPSGRAIFWFRANANECLTRMWELVACLESHGYLIELQKCKWLDNIIYQDDYQVAAYPSKKDRK